MSTDLIRGYERSDLPIEQRLLSLATRFSSLKDAAGISPWDAKKLELWVQAQTDQQSGYHAGLLLLTIWGESSLGPFDIVSAIQIWDETEKKAFLSWFKGWKF